MTPNSDIFAICDSLTDEYAALRPSKATEEGVHGYDDRWDDFSPTGFEHLAQVLAGYRDRIAGLPESEDRWARLAAEVALDYLDLQLGDYEQSEHLRDLNNIASPAQTLRETFDYIDTATAEGWAAIAARLHSLDAAMTSYISSLDEGRRRGLGVARRQVETVIEQATVHAGPESYFNGLELEAQTSGVVSAGAAGDVAKGANAAREAFGELARYLADEYLAEAAERDAVGPERYARRARYFLGMDPDLHETYQWGWDEVERLRGEMDEVAGQIEPGATRAEALRILTTDPARQARDHEEFLAEMRARQEQALRELDGSHFEVPPEIREVDVKVSPPGGPLGAYYVPPREDFSRAGCVYYSLGDPAPVPLYDHVSTAYHEGFPGHHLQCGVQTTLRDNLSRLHRTFVWHAGYGEGWALYTEQLMRDLGYLEKPDYVYGLLAAQMLRACRVVIDIGSHLELTIPDGQPFHPGEPWRFETAVEMLRDYATLATDYARSEVTRYLGWPGQAISYKVGERVIMDLRAEVRRREGSAFDLKAFHARVLGSGPVGLGMLRDLVLAG